MSVNPFFDNDTSDKAQKEFRSVLWWAQEGVPLVEVELGSLADITELIPRRDFSCEIKIDQEFFDDLSREAMWQMDVR